LTVQRNQTRIAQRIGRVVCPLRCALIVTFLARATVGGATAKEKPSQTGLSGRSKRRYLARAARGAVPVQHAAGRAQSKSAVRAGDAQAEPLGMSSLPSMYVALMITSKPSERAKTKEVDPRQNPTSPSFENRSRSRWLGRGPLFNGGGPFAFCLENPPWTFRVI